MTADGAYSAPTYQTIAQHDDGIEVVISPRATVVPSSELRPPAQHDRHRAMLKEQGSLGWQVNTGFGKRSLAETAMGRYKSLMGPRLRRRRFAAQQAGTAIGVAVLNRMLVAGRSKPVLGKRVTA